MSMSKRRLAVVVACVAVIVLALWGLSQQVLRSQRGQRVIGQIEKAFGLPGLRQLARKVVAAKHLDRAIKYVKSKDLNRAEAELQRVLRFDASNSQAHLLLMEFYLIQKRFDDLEAHLRRATAHLPARDASEVFTHAADLCYKGYPKLAESYYQQALRLNPNNAAACNNLGYMWAERGEKPRLAEAEKLIKRALKVEPNSAAFIDSLGWVYYQQGRYRSALRLLKRAVQLQGDDAELQYHLGMAYLKTGDKRKAFKHLNRALEINPNHSGARQALEELAPIEEERHLEFT